jgi:hypothetical protein
MVENVTNILSIDVGIKNLACCVLSVHREKKMYSIKKWDVLDLCKTINISLHCQDKTCNRKVNFISPNKEYFCNIHSKKCKYQIPSKDDKMSSIKKKKIAEIKQYCAQKLIFIDVKDKKLDIIKKIQEYQDKNFLIKIKDDKTKNFTLVDIGKNIVSQLDVFISGIEIHQVLIENQIGPLANKMKTIQGMIAQYFIMKDIYEILFINASNKLKLFDGKKSSYKERKKMGIEVTKKFIEESSQEEELRELFEKHKKKDDLADCFLQGYWFMKEQNML